jgi:hypothetical protein
MSQRDLTAELRSARVVAPGHVRAHVRLIAAAATPPPRRFTWRRALVIALPVAAAVAVAVIVARPSPQHQASPAALERDQLATPATTVHGAVTKSAAGVAPPASPTRAQRYGAFLSLRVATQRGVSDGVKRALAITSSLGGYPVSVHASSETDGATANLTLKVPRSHVGQAIARLSALGTIIGEQVDVQDAQAGLNATDRLIARLQRQIGALRAQEQTDAVKLKTAALTSRRRSTATAHCTVSASPSGGSVLARSTRSRSAARSCCSSVSPGSPSARSGGAASTLCSTRRDAGDHPERRLADR